MEKDYFKWLGGSKSQYAASIAATWIWAPSLLVSANQAHVNGLPGFLMFFIPNCLTLIIFGLIMRYIRSKKDDGYTMLDAISKADKRQQNLNLCMSFALLILSTCCQIVGINTAISFLIDDRLIGAATVSVLSLLLVWKHGLKGSIITDTFKYVILVICVGVLIWLAKDNPINLVGSAGKTPLTTWWEFGMITTLGLLSAPYIDNTFWQRGYSIPKGEIVNTFVLSSLLFAVVPLGFGYVGFIHSNAYFGVARYVMLIATICALVSTLDSNLIAIAGYVHQKLNCGKNISRLAMVAVLCVSCFIFIADVFDLTKLFLSYNTLRCCMVLPTLFIVFNCYDRNRLFWLSLIASLVCPIAYIQTSNPLFTLGALGLTMFGYSRPSEEEK